MTKTQKEINQLKQVKQKAGNITIPVTRVNNGLCLRVHMGTGTDGKGRVWNLSCSGGCLMISVPDKHRYYSVSFGDILREILIKEEARDE